MGGVNKTSSLGWIYVVVSDTRSPRQPVPSWLPGSAVAVYGSLLTVAGILLNVTVLGWCATAAGKGSPVPAVRRLVAANLAVVQLVAAVFVVAPGAVIEALGRWTFGGHACRAWLLGQVLLIAGAMWSTVGLDVDCVLHLVAPRRAYAVLSERHPRTTAAVLIFTSWLTAGLAALPIGLAVSSHQASPDGDSSAVLEDVCAVTLGRAEAIAQSLAAFLLPGAIALTGSATILVTKASGMIGSGPTAVAAVGTANVLLWCPFFVLYVLLPFCGDRMCVDPATWTLFAWIGHSSVVVAPACWFIDPAVRSSVRRLFCCLPRCRSCCNGFHGNVTSSASCDESSGLISVAKYQIHRPAQEHHQPHTDSPTDGFQSTKDP